MQDQRMLPQGEPLIPKPRKKKPSIPKTSPFQTKGENPKRAQELKRPPPSQPLKMASKRSLKNEAPLPMFFHHPEKSTTSDSLPESASFGDEYRTLRREYLMLEEEHSGLGKDLTEVENEVRALEEEKFALLDELVVLEGLVDPSEILSKSTV